jgi:pimeloyl-ACP methyl ester carboxylesterase/ketosteroid isomerase-like protein
MRKIAIILGAGAALLVGAFIALKTPDSDAEAMRAKYGGSAAKFAKTSDGMSVHYRDQGCRDCPALVLLHGSNASLQTFEPLVEILKDRYRLISYDHPGHGLTGPHPRDDYSARGMFDALDAVIAATGIGQFALAGNSMGGRIAWRYALEKPGKISDLILLDASGAPPSPNAEKAELYLGARIMRYSAGRFLAQHITPRSLVRQSILDTVADERFVTEDMVDRYSELLRYPGNRRATGIRAVTDRESHYGQLLGELAMPTLIIWGAEDRVIPPHNAQTFHEMVPNSTLQMFDGVGHLPMEEAPERTAVAIDAFLNATNSHEVSAAQSALQFQSARFTAMVEEDLDALEVFLADDLTYSHTTGWTETKAEFLATVASRKIDYIAMSPKDVAVRVYGDIAVMTGLSKMEGAVGDRNVSFTIRFLDVSRRVGDAWQLVAWQSVRMPEE